MSNSENDLPVKNKLEIENNGKLPKKFITRIKEWFSDTRSLLFISVLTLFIVFIVAASFILIQSVSKSLDTPEKVAETFFRASVNVDLLELKANSAYDIDKILNDCINDIMTLKNYKSEEEVFKYYSAYEGVDIKNIDELINIFKEKYISALSKKFGDDYKIIFNTVETEELTDDDIAAVKKKISTDITKINKNFNPNDYINVDKITEYKKVTFDATISGNKNQTSRDTMYLVKIDGSWRSLDLELIDRFF